MTKIGTEITIDDLIQIEKSLDYIIDEAQLIEIHKSLIGTSCKTSYMEIEDCGVEFICEFLSRDCKRSFAFQYSNGAERFIYSKYLSDYFKEIIKKILVNGPYDEVLAILNSDKDINAMSEEEIAAIYYAIKDFYIKFPETVAKSFMLLLYKLNGSGVISFIKNNVNPMDLARHILLTSGLSDNAGYYSGRGVNFGDLNEENLVAIFNKLAKIDPTYGVNFVEMVRKMPTLGATEFINTFLRFAMTGFNADSLVVDDSNISFNGSNAYNAAAVASYIDILTKGHSRESQIMDSNDMKGDFMRKIMPTLKAIKQASSGLNTQPFNSGSVDKGR